MRLRRPSTRRCQAGDGARSTRFARGVIDYSRTIEQSQIVPTPIDETWEFFSNAANLGRITPRWLSFEILTPQPIEMGVGTLIDYRIRLRGIPMRWRTRIERWEPGRCFVDTQERGPFALWEHTHTFESHADGTLLHDRVRFGLPFGRVGAIAARLVVARDVDRIFAHRKKVIEIGRAHV